jgi:hypothetical protein
MHCPLQACALAWLLGAFSEHNTSSQATGTWMKFSARNKKQLALLLYRIKLITHREKSNGKTKDPVH